MSSGPTPEEVMRRLAAIVKSSDDAIISTTLDGEIVSWNRAAEHMYGYEASEVTGEPVFLVVHPDRHEDTVSYLRSIAEGKRVPHHESIRMTKAGTTLDVSVSMSPIHAETGAVVGASMIERDATEQRWMASTLDGTIIALETTAAEAQEAAERFRRFLADAAHQLRSPIAGAQASVEAILHGAQPPERDRLFGSLVQETARAGRLIAALLRIAHLDEGQTVAPGPCDLVALATEEADRAWALAPHLDIALRADLARDLRPELDAQVVREALANLLDNARRYAVDRIDITIARVDGGVEVRVADDGPGLPEGSEEQAFERFVSLDPEGGSGLGLAIARGLARSHGGDLAWQNRAFVLRLPVGGAADGR